MEVESILQKLEQKMRELESAENNSLFKPAHPFVLVKRLSEELQEQLEVNPLRNELIPYWGTSAAHAIEEIRFDEDLHNNLTASIKKELTHNKIFTDLMSILIIDVVDASEFDTEEDYKQHCDLFDSYNFDNIHTIKKYRLYCLTMMTGLQYVVQTVMTVACCCHVTSETAAENRIR